jgi:hypothetical protein
LDRNDISYHILNQDGAFRDANFLRSSWSGVDRLLAELTKRYKSVQWADYDTGEYQSGAIPHVTAINNEGHWIFNDDTALLPHLQLYIWTEEDGTPDIELCFNPLDLKNTPTVGEEIQTFIKSAKEWLEASDCYLCYEGGDWRNDTLDNQEGVIAHW